ncbi:MAG: hypothetical protein RIB53_17845 [Roseitalea porphyridii]|jgi:hypothetical protein|uniref:hypothetical protein n=1 Tax=Roseitalea porphyridii TaxID=1852022 RepID=UPI0032EF4B7D
MTDFANLTEITPEGEQTVAPAIAPITLADRLAQCAAAPLQPSRPQKPCDHGLFDEVRRNQLDLIDFLRAADSAASTTLKRKE